MAPESFYRIGITCGDPAGIGLEVMCRGVERTDISSRAAVVFYAAPAHLAAEMAFAPLGQRARRISRAEEATEPGIWVIPLLGPRYAPVPGQWDATWAAVARESLERTAADAARGALAGVVNAPVTKRITAEFGDRFPGQTELYAARSGVAHPVMMLAGPTLRVVPITTHIPLRAVADHLTQDLVEATARITEAALRRDFGIGRPRLALCGLNPHAGEDGLMGTEEQVVLRPAVETLRKEGIDISGPHAADTYFHFAIEGRADAVLCPYHDQALIPIKTLYFDEAVNITLGLPFVRTSPDHGTAYDLAGTGQARSSSAENTLILTAKFISNRALT